MRVTDNLRARLTKMGVLLAGVMAGAGVVGLLFIFAVTIVSTISPGFLNPTHWSVFVPLLALLIGALIGWGAVSVIRSDHPLSLIAYGVIFSTVVFCILVFVYYFVYMR